MIFRPMQSRGKRRYQHTRLFTEGLVLLFSDEGVGRFSCAVRGGFVSPRLILPASETLSVALSQQDGALGKNACNTPENSLK